MNIISFVNSLYGSAFKTFFCFCVILKDVKMLLIGLLTFRDFITKIRVYKNLYLVFDDKVFK